MNYLTTVKQIELETRFNQKLGHHTSKITVYFEYLPHIQKLQLACRAEIPNVDKAFMCAVEIDKSFVKDEKNLSILYLRENDWLEELLDLYKQRLFELTQEKMT